MISTLLLAVGLCSAASIGDSAATLEFDSSMRSRLFVPGKGALGPFSASETIVVDGRERSLFKLAKQEASSKRLVLTGEADGLRKELELAMVDGFPGMVFLQATYTNLGKKPVRVTRWKNGSYKLQGPSFWSYQSGSYESRPDWVLPLKPGTRQENYMGMNAPDYGGGTPVVDVWTRDAGVAVGHVELTPKLVSLPVALSKAGTASLGVERKLDRTLGPGESLTTYRTFAAAHRGDYFAALTAYSRYMQKQGLRLPDFAKSAYEPIWCAWGYERGFTPEQVLGTLPKAKELGFKWAVLDDGWQIAEGDWDPVKTKFPGGEADMAKLAQSIRGAGLRPGLWWTPLAADPGTELLKEHPDYLLLGKDGKPRKVSWWDSYYLCPAYAPVRGYTKALVRRMLADWGFEGLKIDGQHLNAAPPCYNPAHKHASPEESFEKTPEFFKEIYETAKSVNPDSMVEVCPCGTAYAFHTMPYMDMPVGSDPESSWQVRHKGKTLKALMGASVPYFGDHVELSTGKDDFASTVGVGGVVGTIFTWPKGSMKESKTELTPEKEKVWKKWADIYREKMLSKGVYRGELYDIGFDRPEAHAVEKDGAMYYAFFAGRHKGKVQLRGLGGGSYRVTDYETGKDYGEVRGPSAVIRAEFRKHLLLEAVPAAP